VWCQKLQGQAFVYVYEIAVFFDLSNNGHQDGVMPKGVTLYCIT
jgi:hypothetical protein